MEVIVQNKKINLTSKDFKTQGGEGLIYIKSNTVYKIYSDKTRSLPENKFKELNKLSNINVIKPQNLIYDNSNSVIGYTMNLVNNSIALCQLFPKAFKDRNSINSKQIQNLILNFRKLVESIHKDKCLIVDCNELNFLIQNSTFDNIYAIDVDSYQTPSYKATAIMPSIRDRHSNTFTENTDWFSFAILTFQMFIGIHPYKGIHAAFKNLDDRMLKNISVLNKAVSLPKACEDVSTIPKNWLDWYERLFEKGERMSPPELFESVVTFARAISNSQTSSNFNIKLLLTLPHKIEHCFYTDKYISILSNKTVQIGNDVNTTFITKDTRAISYLNSFSSICNIEHINNSLFITALNSKIKIKCSIDAEKLLFDKGNLYIKNDESMYLVEYNKNMNIITTVKVANVMKNSTEIYGGCLIQNMLGTKYLTYFDNRSMYNIKLDITETILNVRKVENYLAMIILEPSGEYVFNLYCLETDSIHKIFSHVVTYNDINMTVNTKGIGFAIVDDNIGLIFNKKGTSMITSTDIEMTQRLFSENGNINFYKDNCIYSIGLK